MRSCCRLPSVGWITVSSYSILQQCTSCALEMVTRYNQVYPFESNVLPALNILALDIEVTSETDQFPCNKPKDEIFQMALVYKDSKILLSLPGKDYNNKF